MARQGRLGDKANISADAHGCPGCPHPGTGPAIQGSANVFVNGRPALRVDDVGIHAVCCGSNMWQAQSGSSTVFINGKAAFRQNDPTRHCGGQGKLIEGSSDVLVGDSSGGGGSGGGGGDGGGQAGASDAGSTGTKGADTSGSGAANEAAKPTPVVVAARWSESKAHFGDTVKLRATCGEMLGAAATFTITDNDGKSLATLHATCGDSSVETDWKTPDSGPPHSANFKVEAQGKTAESQSLTMVTRVELRLIIDHDGDEEPVAGRTVVLLVSPSGDRVSAVSDDEGKVVFDEAPSGDWKILMEDD